MTRRSIQAAALLALALSSGCREPEKYPWMIVPGVSLGPVPAGVSERELVQRFGSQVQVMPVSIGEGDLRPGVVLFPNDLRRRIEVVWRDTVAHREIRTVRLEGHESDWRLEGRMRLGADLFEVERLNGGPFTLAGFGWDQEGVVTSWEGGALASAMTGVYVSFRPESRHVGTPPYHRLMGDIPFSSQNGDMRLLDPRVARIVVAFDIAAPR
jgi:hypothetical protein